MLFASAPLPGASPAGGGQSAASRIGDSSLDSSGHSVAFVAVDVAAASARQSEAEKT